MEGEYPGKITSDLNAFMKMDHDFVLIAIDRKDVLMQFARAMGIPLFIDADTYDDVLADAAKSYHFLMDIGQQILRLRKLRYRQIIPLKIVK